MRTIFTEQTSENGQPDTALTQETPETEAEPTKYPVKLKHRGRVLARIYRPSKTYPLYRVSWTVAGKRRMKAFPTYSAAKRHADKLVPDLAKGSQATLLSVQEANDALGAFERLHQYFVATGKRISLRAGIGEYCEAAGRLPEGITLAGALDSFLCTSAKIQRVAVCRAVEDFVTTEEPRTKSSNGERPQLSKKYGYNRAIMLRRFAGFFSLETPVCEIQKEHLDLFIRSLDQQPSKSRNRKHVTSAKARNHYRAAIRQFLKWAVRKDYLPGTHRLLEADAMRPEHSNTAEVQIYTPAELRKLLEAAEGPMRAMIALGGLAGLRTAELLQVDWADVWHVKGHVEITAGKAKTRQRRLVQICPSLAAWLNPYRTLKSGKLWDGHEVTFQQHFCEVCDKAEVKRKPNGLRHSFCSFHLARHGNENETAMQAGNSPAMLHANYKGLATKRESVKWFAVKPAKAANIVTLPNSTSV